MSGLVTRLVEEPPFRVAVRWALQRWDLGSCQTRARWDASHKPAYLLGLLTAALDAQRQGLSRISAIEFGVAVGNGLRVMEAEAIRLEHETGVAIDVYGFDSGKGLPPVRPDYRNHPDWWKESDYEMQPQTERELRAMLRSPDRLIIGDVAETVPEFIATGDYAPIGFVSFDLDLYDSTMPALQILSHGEARHLRRVALYFDDILDYVGHRRGGELRAIDDFNEQHEDCFFIDQWYGIRKRQVFKDAEYLNRMRVFHDFPAIEAAGLTQAMLAFVVDWPIWLSDVLADGFMTQLLVFTA